MASNATAKLREHRGDTALRSTIRPSFYAVIADRASASAGRPSPLQCDWRSQGRGKRANAWQNLPMRNVEVTPRPAKNGRADGRPPVTNAHPVSRHLPGKK